MRKQRLRHRHVPTVSGVEERRGPAPGGHETLSLATMSKRGENFALTLLKPSGVAEWNDQA